MLSLRCFMVCAVLSATGCGSVLEERVEASGSIGPPAVEAVSAARYLELLAELEAPKAGFRPDAATPAVTAGPATLRMTRFFEGPEGEENHFWIETALADLPNLGTLGRGRARVEIQSVRTLDGSNVYARRSRFEGAQFRALELNRSVGERGPYYAATRSVRVAEGVRRSDIAAVEGRLVLKLPVALEVVRLGAAEIGAVREVGSGGGARLEALTGGGATLETFGRPESFVAVIGYGPGGERLTLVTDAVSVLDGTVRRSMVFDRRPESLEVLFAGGWITHTLPFRLERPLARTYPLPRVGEPAAQPLIVRWIAPKVHRAPIAGNDGQASARQGA